MKDILKFVLLFLLSYGLLIYISNLFPVQSLINTAFRNAVEVAVKSALPAAYIETQNYYDENQKLDPNVFYVVYGNPEVIHAEKAFAKKQGLNEYKISTYSIQLYIYQMVTVPLVFLISIFLATPMNWRTKIKVTLISLVALLFLIIGKCVLLVLFNVANAKIGIYTLSESMLEMVFRMVMMLTLGFSVIFIFCLWLLLGFKNSLFSTQFNNFIKSFKK